MDADRLERAEELLGHTFEDGELLEQALTHASTADCRLESNERLEFLGDAVLGLVVCEYLYQTYPDLHEGEMTKIKSNVVSRNQCAAIAAQLGLQELIRLGKGMSNRMSLPDSVVAAVYESLIGALYLDGGLEAAADFILKHVRPRIKSVAGSGHQHNFKSVLQQVTQQFSESPPQYLLLDEQGPDHAKCFEVCVTIGARRFGSCWGPTKKQAEQKAALQALTELGVAEVVGEGHVAIRELDEEVLDLDWGVSPLG